MLRLLHQPLARLRTPRKRPPCLPDFRSSEVSPEADAADESWETASAAADEEECEWRSACSEDDEWSSWWRFRRAPNVDRGEPAREGAPETAADEFPLLVAEAEPDEAAEDVEDEELEVSGVADWRRRSRSGLMVS